MKAAPALTAGNVLISKASEMNPLSALLLGSLAIEAGVPPGVLNVPDGAAEAGVALSSHVKIRKIRFTAVGKKIQVAATNSNLKRVTLELGRKSPVLVSEDARLDEAVEKGSRFLAFNGQGCVLGMRIYMHESIAEKYLEDLKARVEGYAESLGADPFEMSTMSSPLFHSRQKEAVMQFLEQGKKEVEVVTGGNSWGSSGCFVESTIFFKPVERTEIVRKEVFGPVVVADTFKTEEEVLKKANDTEYGLGASVYTRDLDRAVRVAGKLEAGTVTANNTTPFHPTTPFRGFKSENFLLS